MWRGQGIGNGQTWQYPARSGGVTYTNTTGRTIAVSVNVLGNAPGSWLYVDGVPVSFTWVNGAGSYQQLFGLVPPGSTYYVSSALIQWWLELR